MSCHLNTIWNSQWIFTDSSTYKTFHFLSKHPYIFPTIGYTALWVPDNSKMTTHHLHSLHVIDFLYECVQVIGLVSFATSFKIHHLVICYIATRLKNFLSWQRFSELFSWYVIQIVKLTHQIILIRPALKSCSGFLYSLVVLVGHFCNFKGDFTFCKLWSCKTFPVIKSTMYQLIQDFKIKQLSLKWLPFVYTCAEESIFHT